MLQDVGATAPSRFRRARRDATRVLVAHADRAVRRRMARVLRDAGCIAAEEGAAGGVLDAAWRHRPHALLLDAALDGGDGVPLLHRVKSDPDLFRIAVVMVGGPDGVEETLSAMEHGAHDILPGAACGPEVVARVRAARCTHDLREQLLSRERDLERLAYFDELTGLPNRRFVLRQLEALLSRARRHDLDLALLMVDADHFKALNDRHGHHTGDLVLRGIAGRLGERVRREDVVGRFGGEEFVVALPDTDADGAAAVAEDLRAAVAGRRIRAGRRSLPVTISVGWAAWEGESLDGLLARADDALYAAKDAGRDAVRGAPAARALSR